MVEKTRVNKNIIVLIYVLVVLLAILLLIKYSSELVPREPETDDIKTVEVEIWTIHGDIEKALNESIETYQSNFPEIEFKVKVFKNEVYQSAIANALVTDTLPDIFFCWGYQKLKDYVDAEAIFDITNYVNKKGMIKDMKPGVFDGFRFNNKYYGMPLYGWNVSLFCNRGMFQQNNIVYPENYDQLIEAIDIFKKKGIIPMAVGGKETWLPSLYYMSFVLESGTIHEIYEAAEDRQRFKTPPFIQAATRFEDLVNTNPWQEYYGEYDSYNAAYLFTQGKTAMLLTGSWVSTAIDSNDSLVQGNVDVIPFPNGNKSLGVGGYVDTYVINKKSVLTQKDEYINLYIDLMQSIAKISCDELGIGVPVYNNQRIDKEKFPTLYQCMLNDQGRLHHPAYDQIFSAELTDQYYELLSGLMVGEIKADEFIELMAME